MCQLFSQQNVMFSRSRLLHNTILKYISIISPIVFFNQISAVNMKDRKISNFFNLSHGLYAYVHISTTRCASCMPDTVMYFSVKEHVIFLFSPEKNEATFCWFWNQTQNLMIKGSWDSEWGVISSVVHALVSVYCCVHNFWKGSQKKGMSL